MALDSIITFDESGFPPRVLFKIFSKLCPTTWLTISVLLPVRLLPIKSRPLIVSFCGIHIFIIEVLAFERRYYVSTASLRYIGMDSVKRYIVYTVGGRRLLFMTIQVYIQDTEKKLCLLGFIIFHTTS